MDGIKPLLTITTCSQTATETGRFIEEVQSEQGQERVNEKKREQSKKKKTTLIGDKDVQ